MDEKQPPKSEGKPQRPKRRVRLSEPAVEEPKKDLPKDTSLSDIARAGFYW